MATEADPRWLVFHATVCLTSTIVTGGLLGYAAWTFARADARAWDECGWVLPALTAVLVALWAYAFWIVVEIGAAVRRAGRARESAAMTTREDRDDGR